MNEVERIEVDRSPVIGIGSLWQNSNNEIFILAVVDSPSCGETSVCLINLVSGGCWKGRAKPVASSTDLTDKEWESVRDFTAFERVYDDILVKPKRKDT